MENNRMLLISAAGTRKTKHWPRSEMLWSGIYRTAQDAGQEHGNPWRSTWHMRSRGRMT